MEELDKYKLVNKCSTVEQLANAIRTIANGPVIAGKTYVFDAEKMANRVKQVVENDMQPNVLTRMYGIRQQALYLRYYYGPNSERVFKVIETPVLNNLGNLVNPK